MNQSIFTANVSFLPRIDGNGAAPQTITLGRALLSDQWRAQVEAVRAEKDPDRQDELKHSLPCFTPSGTFRHISRAGLVRHSGFLSIDIDCKPDKGINAALVGYDLKAAIAAVPHVAYCGRSCRGAGYVVVIPIADPAKHSEYFRALAYHFRRAGLEIDKSCGDICRRRFVSWDPDPYINTGARPWSFILPERDRSAQETPGPDLAEASARVEAVISACEQNGWDITADREDWVQILSSLANTFGEGGREYAHRISARYPGYVPEETDSKYSDLLRHPEYKWRIGTLFHIYQREERKHDLAEMKKSLDAGGPFLD